MAPVIPRAIYLVRHGESAAGVDESIHESMPDHLIPLTPRGERQSEATGAWLAAHCADPVWVWCSTTLRTEQTLEGLQRGGLRMATVRHTPLLREQELTGALDAPEIAEQAVRLREVVGKFHLRMPGGESRGDVFLRVTVWMDELWRAFRDDRKQLGSVVVVTHGVTLLMIRGRWMHWDVTRMQTEAKPENGGVYVLAHAPDSARPWEDRGLVFAPARP